MPRIRRPHVDCRMPKPNNGANGPNDRVSFLVRFGYEPSHTQTLSQVQAVWSWRSFLQHFRHNTIWSAGLLSDALGNGMRSYLCLSVTQHGHALLIGEMPTASPGYSSQPNVKTPVPTASARGWCSKVSSRQRQPHTTSTIGPLSRLSVVVASTRIPSVHSCRMLCRTERLV